MIYPFLLTISQFTISISKIWCTLVYIAESRKPGSKRFNSIKKTMHFAHLVALFIYKYRILCSKRQTGVISLNFRTWVGERERGRDRRRERGGESEWERERVCGVKSFNLRREKVGSARLIESWLSGSLLLHSHLQYISSRVSQFFDIFVIRWVSL